MLYTPSKCTVSFPFALTVTYPLHNRYVTLGGESECSGYCFEALWKLWGGGWVSSSTVLSSSFAPCAHISVENNTPKHWLSGSNNTLHCKLLNFTTTLQHLNV